MIKVIHTSDMHFHQDKADNTSLQPMLSGIKNEYFESGDSYLLVTGDITDDGHAAQYQNAFAALKMFGIGRVFISPGNHDVGGSGIFYNDSCTRSFDELAIKLGYDRLYFPKKAPVSRVIRGNDGNRVMIIGVNGVLKTTSPFDWACGKIGRRQLEALEAIVSNPQAAHVPKLVHLHYHPFMHTDPVMMLKDSKRFMRVIQGKVQVLCFGHKHVQQMWRNVNGIPWVLAAGALALQRKVWEICFADSKVTGVNECVIPSLEP